MLVLRLRAAHAGTAMPTALARQYMPALPFLQHSCGIICQHCRACNARVRYKRCRALAALPEHTPLLAAFARRCMSPWRSRAGTCQHSRTAAVYATTALTWRYKSALPCLQRPRGGQWPPCARPRANAGLVEASGGMDPRLATPEGATQASRSAPSRLRGSASSSGAAAPSRRASNADRPRPDATGPGRMHPPDKQ